MSLMHALHGLFVLPLLGVPFPANDISATGAALATPVLGVVFPDEENDDAWVTELADGGPAAKAGLRPGDTITALDDETVKTVKRIRELLKKHKPGDEVKVAVRRGTKSLTFTVKLGMGQ